MSYSHGALIGLLIFLAFLIGMAIGRHRPRVMARSGERKPAGPMPWCQRCRCYHHHTAPHIDRPAFLRRQAE